MNFPIPHAQDWARTLRLALVPACYVAVLGFAQSSPAAGTVAAARDSDTIGVIGQGRITEADVIAADKSEFDDLSSSHTLELHHLQLQFAKSRHKLLQKRLDIILDQKAVEMEAKARGVGSDAVLAELKLVVPSEDEAHAFYEANKDRIKAPYEQVAPKVHEYLATQVNETAARKFYDGLRARHGIRSTLGPYRESVAAQGPARGQKNAPVTIVEFGDFQCPYCKEAESSLRAILTKYPQDVRIVFRNLPLTQIHPNAKLAAEAAVCADRQGKFWEIHDAMYDDQSALSLESLNQTATRLGLNTDRFAACLADGSTSSSLDADAQAAQELGLDGTPSFFINGRPLEGNVPVEKFESVISDELRRASGAPQS